MALATSSVSGSSISRCKLKALDQKRVVVVTQGLGDQELVGRVVGQLAVDQPLGDDPDHRPAARRQGLTGQADWQHKGAKRGGDAGPIQRDNPWSGMNQPNTPMPSQASDE